MDNIDYVAWWGAIIATSVLLWDVVKWLRSGARLKYRILFNVHYDDGKVLKKEKTEYGESIIYEEYCHIELINNGSLPTTIMNIIATHSKKKKSFQISSMQQAFIAHYEKNYRMFLTPVKFGHVDCLCHVTFQCLNMEHLKFTYLYLLDQSR